MECAFCSDASIAGRTIAESELAKAFLTSMPITPGHTLVVPKRHVELFAGMNSQEEISVFALTEQVKHALRNVFNAEGFNIAWNEGEAAGQSIPHFHLHIVPRTEGDAGILEYEPRKFLYRPGTRAESPQQELESIALALKPTPPEV